MITSLWFCLTSAFLLSVSTKCNSLFSCSLAYPFPVQTVQLRSYCFKSACWKCHWSPQVIRWCKDLFKRLSPTPAPGGQHFKLLLAKDTPTACLSPLETAAWKRPLLPFFWGFSSLQVIKQTPNEGVFEFFKLCVLPFVPAAWLEVRCLTSSPEMRLLC